MRNLPHPHTWEDKQLQSNKHPSTHTPLSWCLSSRLQEWVELMWNVWSLSWLRSWHIVVPTCAPQWSMSTIGGLCQTISAAGNLGNLSHAGPLVAVPLYPAHTHTHKNTHTHTAHTLFIQRHGGWPSFTHREERQQRWDTGKKSSEDLQTRVSVWAPTAAEVGLFLELWGIHPVNLHNWNATRVST